MKGSSRRPEQVAENIRQVIADAVTREIRDPRVGFVTITGVEVTIELSHARIRVSVTGDEEAKQRRWRLQNRRHHSARESPRR
jgi:ribosome-binding factor A